MAGIEPAAINKNTAARSIRSKQPDLSPIEGFHRCAPFKTFQTYGVKVSAVLQRNRVARELDSIVMEMEGDVRSGHHAFAEHDEDHSPHRLEQEKHFGAPNRVDAGRQFRHGHAVLG
jgi:hypothetical protein